MLPVLRYNYFVMFMYLLLLLGKVVDIYAKFDVIVSPLLIYFIIIITIIIVELGC